MQWAVKWVIFSAWLKVASWRGSTINTNFMVLSSAFQLPEKREETPHLLSASVYPWLALGIIFLNANVSSYFPVNRLCIVYSTNWQLIFRHNLQSSQPGSCLPLQFHYAPFSIKLSVSQNFVQFLDYIMLTHTYISYAVPATWNDCQSCFPNELWVLRTWWKMAYKEE